jgi:predicted O-methyltransferase YrrM
MALSDLELMFQRYSRGSVSVGDIETLVHFARDLPLVVELGTNIGTTSILLKSVAQRVCTVDVFENINLIADEKQREIYRESFKHNQHYYSTISNKLASFGVESFQGLSHDFATKFNRESVGMVFVDADHSRAGIERDYDAWFDRVMIGGFFAFHDYIPNYDVYNFVNDIICKDERIAFQPFGLECGQSSVVVFKKIK